MLLPAGLSRACTHRAATCWACTGNQATVRPAVKDVLAGGGKSTVVHAAGGIPQACQQPTISCKGLTISHFSLCQQPTCFGLLRACYKWSQLPVFDKKERTSGCLQWCGCNPQVGCCIGATQLRQAAALRRWGCLDACATMRHMRLRHRAIHGAVNEQPISAAIQVAVKVDRITLNIQLHWN